MSDSYYDLAQICLNGHVINEYARDFPEHNQRHCDKCGKETVTQCRACGSEIRGHYHVPGVVDISSYTRPSYCHSCGSPYPWTEAALAAASEMAEEIDSLEPDEVAKLKETLPDLLQEGPRTELAVSRFRKLMNKAGGEAYEAMKGILVNVVSEVAKKSLFGV